MDFYRNNAIKSAMADATTRTARLIGHMTYTQAPAVHEKNFFHLFRFTQPVKNYSERLVYFFYAYSTFPVHVYDVKQYQLCDMRTTEKTARTNVYPLSINKFLFLYREASEAFHESRFVDVTWISLSNI